MLKVLKHASTRRLKVLKVLKVLKHASTPCLQTAPILPYTLAVALDRATGLPKPKTSET